MWKGCDRVLSAGLRSNAVVGSSPPAEWQSLVQIRRRWSGAGEGDPQEGCVPQRNASRHSPVTITRIWDHAGQQSNHRSKNGSQRTPRTPPDSRDPYIFSALVSQSAPVRQAPSTRQGLTSTASIVIAQRKPYSPTLRPGAVTIEPLTFKGPSFPSILAFSVLEFTSKIPSDGAWDETPV
jgi:hypothetical protein